MDIPPLPSLVPSIPHADRSIRLIVFGVLTVVLGGLLVAMVPLLVMSLAAMPASATGERPIGSMIGGTLIYGGLGGVLVLLGVGSILAKRWARALLLIGSWSTLVMGIFTVGMLVCLMPSITRLSQPQGGPPLPPGAVETGLWIGVLFVGFFCIFVPGLWVLIYGSRHVKATCEARNPAPAWTDACPLPVLAVSLWLVMGAFMMLASLVSTRAVMPFFGLFLTGGAGVLASLVFAGVWSAAAWWIYHLERFGWWVVVAAMVLFTLSNLVTYTRRDLGEVYQQMGLPAEQLEALNSMPFLSGQGMLWMTAGMMVPILLYLAAIRHHFRRRPPTSA